MARPRTPLPDDILALRTRLAQWRETHPVGSPLPEELWQEATALAVRHGVHRTARALPVDYASLSKRAGQAPAKAPAVVRRIAAPKTKPQPQPQSQSEQQQTSFVDLLLPAPAQQRGVVVELLRIQSHVPLDWTQLLTAWRQPKPQQ